METEQSRDLSDRELLEYIADMGECLIKRQEEGGLKNIVKMINHVLAWRKHDGGKVIDDVIAELHRSSQSITIRDVKTKLKEKFMVQLREAGEPNPTEAVQALIGFLYYQIRHKVGSISSGTVRSRRIIRDDDSFRFIPRSTSRSTSEHGDTTEESESTGRRRFSSETSSDPTLTHQISPEL
ncbi:hypothetical protein ADUPG1_004957 [Aduncisulcus paluster]|uniref:Uncharacterized protein n=1 Tax=Aduncisulcus paluster TaxID=2918883 RepID=A0ABQ5K7E0_9EUKA|nr:hypothetical protein ADUPG1_004957 [Aduncisulcus paluster]